MSRWNGNGDVSEVQIATGYYFSFNKEGKWELRSLILSNWYMPVKRER